MATIDPTNSMLVFVLGMAAFVAVCYILTLATNK